MAYLHCGTEHRLDLLFSHGFGTDTCRARVRYSKPVCCLADRRETFWGGWQYANSGNTVHFIATYYLTLHTTYWGDSGLNGIASAFVFGLYLELQENLRFR